MRSHASGQTHEPSHDADPRHRKAPGKETNSEHELLADHEHEDELKSEDDSEIESDSEGEQEHDASAARAPSLFAGKVPWESQGANAHEATDKSAGGAPAHLAKATANPYVEGGNRPKVHLAKSVRGTDADGKPGIARRGSEPHVSAVAGNQATLYLHGGTFLVVKVSKLKAAVAAGSKKNLKRVLRIRALDVEKKEPREGTLRTVTLPAGLGEGWKPLKTGGESITGRGKGPIIWGTTNPTGPDGSGTGYVALPMHTGTQFKELKEIGNGVQWVRPDGKTGKAIWAEGWAEIHHGEWVRQFMVSRIVPDDPAVPQITFLS